MTAEERRSNVALELDHISKSFGSIKALRDVSLTLRSGEIHAIVGENGAGKSTLINVASGNLTADVGTLAISGKAMSRPSPDASRRQGVSVVFQHPALIGDLTIEENLQLAHPRLDEFQARQLLRRIAPDRALQLGARVDGLTLAELHIVEVARALASDPSVIFLDEPTEPLQKAEVDQLFALLSELRSNGAAIAYVSHRLHEVMQIADRITVMRDGAVIAQGARADFEHDQIVALISGRAVGQVFPPKCAAPGEVIFEAKKVSGRRFSDVSFRVHRGEILGFAGVDGEGQREALRALAGLEKLSAGSVILAGARLSLEGVRDARDAGVRFVPDDRHQEGLFASLSVRENIVADALTRVSRFGFVVPAAETGLAQGVTDAFNIKTASQNAAVSSLSGGNQQKVVLGRALQDQPSVLLVDEPTKGVDVGARSDIYRRLRDLSADGVPVVILSSDATELAGICDRVIVFSRGQVSRELSGADVSEVGITGANLSATSVRSSERKDAAAWLRGAFDNDLAPAAVLIPIILLIAGFTQTLSPHFLAPFSLGSMFLLLSVLALISLGQLLVVMVGGVDISVGALAGLCPVLASFLLPAGSDALGLTIGIVEILAIATAYGIAQGFAVSVLRLPAIVVTLATFVAVQGVSLTLRPTPDGAIAEQVATMFEYRVGVFPAALLLTLCLFAIAALVVTRTSLGRALRATGSSAVTATRIGLPAALLVTLAFAVCGLLTGIAGLILAGEVGVGSAVTGADFSIMSISAVMIGGAKVSGGRGSVIATLTGAGLVQIISSASSFLYSDSAFHNLELGVIVIVASLFFSVARR